MKIAHDENLKRFSTLTDMTEEEAEKKVLKRLERIVQDIPDNYGQQIKDSYDFGDLQMCDVLAAVNLSYIDTCIYDAYINLKVMGDFDCPKCGAKMEVFNEYGYTIESNGITPTEHVITSCDLECPVCGEILTNCKY